MRFLFKDMICPQLHCLVPLLDVYRGKLLFCQPWQRLRWVLPATCVAWSLPGRCWFDLGRNLYERNMYLSQYMYIYIYTTSETWSWNQRFGSCFYFLVDFGTHKVNLDWLWLGRFSFQDFSSCLPQKILMAMIEYSTNTVWYYDMIILTIFTSIVVNCRYRWGVETHGTGTALGDPMEVGALQTALGVSGRQRPLQLGAAKTNVGHLEGGAGVAFDGVG